MKGCFRLFFLWQAAWGQSFLDGRGIIDSPALTVKCQVLMARHNRKLEARGRAKSLLRRAQTLGEVTPLDRPSIRRKFELSAQRLEWVLSALELRIKQVKEDVVRGGCPGLVL